MGGAVKTVKKAVGLDNSDKKAAEAAAAKARKENQILMEEARRRAETAVASMRAGRGRAAGGLLSSANIASGGEKLGSGPML